VVDTYVPEVAAGLLHRRRVALNLTVQVGQSVGMAARRRPRGSLVDPVGVHWDVERTAKERFSAIARNANVSEAVLFEHVVLTLELTDQGVPTTWAPNSRDGELPIDSA